MKKLTSILIALAVVGLLSACSEAPVKSSGNSAEVQRAHAAKGQSELSSEVKK